jgi:nucleotide-binding universal stress UspA family protein
VAIAPAGYATHQTTVKKIGVGYDGSPASDEALVVARTLAADRDAEVSVFEAVRVARHVDDPLNLEGETDADAAQARRRLGELGDVEPHAAYGDTTDELARYGESVDLLVIGAHKFNGLDRLVKRTTSEQLSERASCPLLVLGTSVQDTSIALRG